MKKIFSILMVVMFATAMAACGEKENSGGTTPGGGDNPGGGTSTSIEGAWHCMQGADEYILMLYEGLNIQYFKKFHWDSENWTPHTWRGDGTFEYSNGSGTIYFREDMSCDGTFTVSDDKLMLNCTGLPTVFVRAHWCDNADGDNRLAKSGLTRSHWEFEQGDQYGGGEYHGYFMEFVNTGECRYMFTSQTSDGESYGHSFECSYTFDSKTGTGSFNGLDRVSEPEAYTSGTFTIHDGNKLTVIQEGGVAHELTLTVYDNNREGQ